MRPWSSRPLGSGWPRNGGRGFVWGSVPSGSHDGRSPGALDALVSPGGCSSWGINCCAGWAECGSSAQACVIFGHYWRSIRATEDGRSPDQSNPLAHIDGLRWLGPHRNAFCVDYCAGVRYLGRQKGMDLDACYPLVAIRLPAHVTPGDSHPLIANDGTVRMTRTLPT